MTKQYIPLILAILVSSTSLFAQPTLELTSYATGFAEPVDITNANDGTNRLFIVEKTGTIRIFDQDTGTVLPNDYLDIDALVSSSGERGLLGLAFAPDFAVSGYFFVNYINNIGDVVIARYQQTAASPNDVDESTGEIFLTFDRPRANHNAGDIEFGSDGYLWIPTGDSGSGNAPDNLSQDSLALQGKILRIDVDVASPPYLIPADNPFIGDPLVADEVWGIGLRNPFRISFDGDDLWIADVGQNAREEVDFIQDAANNGGLNFGWRCFEGTLQNANVDQSICLPASSYTEPVFEYGHNNATGGFSITGGHVYRGTQFPDLIGLYVVADYVSSNFWVLTPQADGSVTSDLQQPLSGLNISTFGRDEVGELYAGDLSSGTIYQVRSSTVLPVTLSSWMGTYRAISKSVELKWTTAEEVNSDTFIIEHSLDGTIFKDIGEIEAAGNTNTEQSYSFIDSAPEIGINYYRLRQTDQDGKTAFSEIITIERVDGSSKPKLFPNPVQQGLANIILPPDWLEYEEIMTQIYSIDGRTVGQQLVIESISGNTIQVPIGNLPVGSYFIQLQAKDKVSTVKFQVN